MGILPLASPFGAEAVRNLGSFCGAVYAMQYDETFAPLRPCRGLTVFNITPRC